MVSAAASPRSSRLFAASEEPIFDAEVVSDGSVEGESGEMEADSVVVVEEEFSPREEGAKFPGKYFVSLFLPAVRNAVVSSDRNPLLLCVRSPERQVLWDRSCASS